MTVRALEARDLPQVEAIQGRCPEAAQWKCGDYLEHLALVAEIDGMVAGFIVLRWLVFDVEILTLAVDPAHRRRGVARSLLQNACTDPSATYFLEVRESNSPARQLYEAYGFSVIGKRYAYYDNPGEDAIVMQLQQ